MLKAPDLQMRMPFWDAAWRRRTAAGFQARGDSPLSKIIGAMDDVAILNERPSATEVTCTIDYWNWNKFFALNVQAVCDSNYMLTWMSCRTSGSAHDSTALAVSDVGRLLSERRSPLTMTLIAEGLCIAADEAYADSEVLAVAWPGGRGGDIWRDGYHFYQSSARIQIEQAFGQLARRWGILWRPPLTFLLSDRSLSRSFFRCTVFAKRMMPCRCQLLWIRPMRELGWT